MKRTLFVLALLITASGYGQNEDRANAPETEPWQFQVTPYFWFTGLTGEIGFQNGSIPVEADFGDLMEKFAAGLLLHAEASKGRWFIMGDMIYLKLTKDGTIEQVNIPAELEVRQFVGELGGGYNLFNSQDWLFIDVFGGLRHFSIATEVDAAGTTALDRTTNVNDPFVGLRFRTLTEKWINSARIDAGGFGLGSEISWKANIFVGYRFSETFSVLLGIQGYGVDYNQNDFDFDFSYAGVATGLNFTF